MEQVNIVQKLAERDYSKKVRQIMAFETIDQVVKAKSENSSINYKFVGHCVEISRICSDTSYIFFLQEFVKAFLLAKRVDFTKKDIVRENFSFFHTMLERLRTSNYESCCMSLLSKTLTQLHLYISPQDFRKKNRHLKSNYYAKKIALFLSSKLRQR